MIGAGGMGEVYRARDMSAEPIDPHIDGERRSEVENQPVD